MITIYLWKKKKEKKLKNKLAKERFKETTELTDETNLDDLLYYYKNMSKKSLMIPIMW